MSNEIWFEAFTLENYRITVAKARWLKANLEQNGKFWFKDAGGAFYFTQGSGCIQIEEDENIGCQIKVWYKNGDGPKVAEAWKVFKNRLDLVGPLIEVVEVSRLPIDQKLSKALRVIEPNNIPSDEWRDIVSLMVRLTKSPSDGGKRVLEEIFDSDEYKILQIMVDFPGISNFQISQSLSLSESRTRNKKSKIYSKLNLEKSLTPSQKQEEARNIAIKFKICEKYEPKIA